MRRFIIGLAIVSALSASVVNAQPVPARLFARVGDDLGNGQTLSTLSEPFSNAFGQVGYVYSQTDGVRGIRLGNGGVFLSSQYLPDTVTGGELTMGISNAGDFIYSPSWNGEDAVATSSGLLLRGGDPAPNLPGLFSAFNSRPRMAPDGTAWWIGGTSDSAGGATQGRVLWKCPNPASVSSCVPVVRTGDLINGLAVGASGIGFAYDFSDDSDDYIALMLLGEDTASDGHIVVNGVGVAREGSTIDGVESWQNFGGMSINNFGNYVFSGDTSGATATDGFIAVNGGIALREGAVVDGLMLVGNPLALSMNNIGQRVAFIWNTNMGEALFLGPAASLASSTAILVVGQQVDVDGDGVGDYDVTDFNASLMTAPGLDNADFGRVHARVDLRIPGETVSEQAIVGVAVPVVNDNCWGAIVIESNTDVLFSNVGATTDGGTETACNFFGYSNVGSDIWFRWVADCTEQVTVSLCGSFYDTKVAVYSDCPVGVNESIACNDDSCGLQSQFSFAAVAGTTYRIRVGGFQGLQGAGTLRITACQPPPNDTCPEAIDIVANTNIPFNNAGAASDGLPEVACQFQGPRSDIWFRWVAECTEQVTVSLCGSSFDTILAIYTACPVGLDPAIACNNDFCGLQSEVSFAAVAGTTYRIRVGGVGLAVGAGTLRIDACQIPPNDDCADAIDVVANTDIPFSNINATTDGGSEVICTFFGDSGVGSDIWFRWVAECTDQVEVSLCGSSYDTKLAVYTDCPAGPNQAIVCNDDFCGLQSRVGFAAVAGTTYRIRVGGYQSAVGVGTLRVDACPIVANDYCADAIDVSSGGTFFGTLVDATNDGAASCGQSADEPDVWYRVTAPHAGTLRVTTCGTNDAGGVDSGLDSVLSLHPTCGGPSFACLDDSTECGDLDQGLLRDSVVTAEIGAGQTVLIRVSQFALTTPAPFRLNVTLSPGNDRCADAYPVTLGETSFTNVAATTDGPPQGEPCDQWSDVWYRFVPACNAPVRVSTCGADFDSEIAVYNTPICGIAPALVCNDDFCGLQSRVVFLAVLQNNYLIRVGGRTAQSQGSGTLRVTLAADWNNDVVVNSGDISAFLAEWLANVQGGGSGADFNGDTVVNSSDISAFLAAWLASVGC